ncbi:hypothetical protein LCGC14_0716370 [marine sediment metagenome]|uniref:Uncharacterized protein n=1 Tax=marine sediment metagenome TaxID=412755 RepID=A0A0F9TL38_9ZZZZ
MKRIEYIIFAMLIITIVVQIHNIIKTFQIEKIAQGNIELMQKNQDSLEILIERTENITDRVKNKLNKTTIILTTKTQ